ncbi:hypothetical protein [Pseudoxanthomonas sp. 10H]|uniref:hypothetical protein n=1 Tax=Pseudoxanthomonas sp. 10H TaxID=3242729 RepID=UPI003558C106
MSQASTSTWHDEATVRAVALAGTALLLALAGRLLGGLPRPPVSTAEGPRVQLVFSTQVPAAAPRPAPPPPLPVDIATPAVSTPAPGQAPLPAPVAAPAAGAPAPGPLVLYDADGRVQVPVAPSDRWTPSAPPPGTAPAPDGRSARLLQRPNPVEVRGTRFARDWVSDGDAADVVAQQIARAQRKIAEFLFGGDIQHAQARPSPEVRFNPARHERRADLGSEATGDAYKAAPISYQPAPGLDGEASRRIREQVAALETAYARCDRARLQRLMQPLLAHLDELQKAEAAFASGADPVRAEHMLPNVANGAYDMARRALWYADRQMAGCAG